MSVFSNSFFKAPPTVYGIVQWSGHRFILRHKMRMGRNESINATYVNVSTVYYNKPSISPLKKCLNMNKQLPPLIIKIDNK